MDCQKYQITISLKHFRCKTKIPDKWKPVCHCKREFAYSWTCYAFYALTYPLQNPLENGQQLAQTRAPYVFATTSTLRKRGNKIFRPNTLPSPRPFGRRRMYGIPVCFSGNIDDISGTMPETTFLPVIRRHVGQPGVGFTLQGENDHVRKR